MKQTRLADRLTANQIEAKNVEERNLSEMEKRYGRFSYLFSTIPGSIKNKTSVKFKKEQRKELASIRRSLRAGRIIFRGFVGDK